MKVIMLMMLGIIGAVNISAQNLIATGARISCKTQVIKNIKKDFGAVGNGKVNDHEAFKRAAAFIIKNGGNVRLIIPGGIYVVGKQKINKAILNASVIYDGDPVLSFKGIRNVSIEGTAETRIIYKAGMYLGTFEPVTGLAPKNLNRYNPSSPKNENTRADYKYAATAGNFINLIDCDNIIIRNLDLNGNSDNYRFGGYWGLGGNPFELSNCYGIFLWNIRNCTFENLKIHDFVVDNISLGSTFTNGDTSKALTENILFNKIECTYAGRNNFTWLGGKNICVSNSSFKYAGAKKIKTAPAAGMDIEPEGEQSKVACTQGFFYNNVYAYNGGLAMTPGTSLDNPVWAEGYGYSYNHYFRKCKFIGKSNAAVYNFINRITYDSCEFYGFVLNYGSSIKDNIAPATFKNSSFSDCYNGERMFDQPLLSIEFGYRMHLDNCVFNKYYSSGPNDWVYFYGTTTYPCSDESNKPLFENSTFKFFAPADNTVKYLCVSRQTKFRNNKFYKPASGNFQWYNVPGCKPGVGEGNTDLGNGMQYYILPKNIVTPKCPAK